MQARTARRTVVVILGVMAVLLAAPALSGDAEAGRSLRGILLVAGSVGLIWFLVFWYRDRPERDAARAEARLLGLTFSPDDPFGLHAMPFRLLTRLAHSRDVRNVMWGTWRGIEVRAFELREQRSEKVRLRFACAATPAPPGWRPFLVIGETPLGRAADAVGLRDVELESEDFNRTFEVRAEDRAFATALLDQRLMAWLLERPWITVEVAGGALLCAVPLRAGWVMEPALDTLRGFLDRVPPVVSSLYGPGHPSPGTPGSGY